MRMIWLVVPPIVSLTFGGAYLIKDPPRDVGATRELLDSSDEDVAENNPPSIRVGQEQIPTQTMKLPSGGSITVAANKGTQSIPLDLDVKAQETPSPKPLPTTAGTRAEKMILDQKIKGVIPVYFQTNRKVKEGSPFTLEQVTFERSSAPTFGMVRVSIPAAHKLGRVETPQLNWWGAKEAENIGEHFTVFNVAKLTREEFLASMSTPAKSILLFVHGYNVSFVDASFTSAQIAFDAKYKGRVVMFSWPSKGGLLDYDYDRESATLSSDSLFDLLKTIKTQADITRIILVAHSLGSEVVIGALQQAALSSTKLGITELIFAASDVSRDLYLQRATQIIAAADHVTLYASSTDKALLTSLKKAQSGSRMGYVTKNGPTLVPGIETIDVSAVGGDMFSLNHGTYAKSRAVLDDIGRLLIRSDHPPHTRTTSLEAVPDDANPKYWRYPD
jgi:esterase/lipase superfamily enzyme